MAATVRQKLFTKVLASLSLTFVFNGNIAMALKTLVFIIIKIILYQKTRAVHT